MEHELVKDCTDTKVIEATRTIVDNVAAALDAKFTSSKGKKNGGYFHIYWETCSELFSKFADEVKVRLLLQVHYLQSVRNCLKYCNLTLEFLGSYPSVVASIVLCHLSRVKEHCK